MNENLITACIVLYKNDKLITQKAINSFLSTELNVKLFLVDNSPSDGLKILVTDSRIEYFHNPSNPGFGASHNIAIKQAIELLCKYHIVLNPDVYYEIGTIERMIEYMDVNPQIGNLMPKVFYPDESTQYLCKLLPTPYDWIGRRFNPFKKMVNRRNEIFELRFTNYNKIMEVPYLSGCFMFLRLDAIKKIGFFDENIFMYGEETDLCRRLNIGGFKTIFYPDATITHVFEKGSHKSWKLTWIGIKSAIYYFNKWGWYFDKERKRINKETLDKLRQIE
jgi:GT2 family glycosyltransferase